MTRRILEREHELDVLGAAARDAGSGRGSVVLLYGEAGIGKSSVVEALRGRIPAEGRMLVGQCDDLATARVLGPFRDVIGAVGNDLGAALRDGNDRDRILTALRGELDWTGHPTVLVIEDVHWADEASLDVLRYLVRRIAELPTVLVLTYRDDEVGREHPLRQVLGLVTGPARRLPLRRLSPTGVRELSAGGDVDADEVFAITAGNPFFVGELLAAGTGSAVPGTVVDAVLARLVRLDQPTRAAVEQLSVVPTAIEHRLVDALVPGRLPALAQAEERGLLTVSSSGVAFRHELARRAVADGLAVARRMALNARVLAILIDDPDADVARIIHHAAEAGDHAAIRRYAPQAARSAAAGGSHREAVAHYRLVLEQADAFEAAERATLLEGYALECRTIGASARAVVAQRQAVELRRSLGDDTTVGFDLCMLSRMEWWAGDRAASERTAQQAVALAEEVGDVRLLSMAYHRQSGLDAISYRSEAAIPVAERAVAFAREAGDALLLSRALNDLGIAHWHRGDPEGPELLDESLRIALDAGHTDHACLAYVNAGWELLNQFEMAKAERYVEAGTELAERVEELGFLEYLYVMRARLQFARGLWDEALRTAGQTVSTLAMIQCTALALTGRIRIRRGEPDGAVELAAAIERARQMDEIQWLGPAVCGAAEEAWLRGDSAGVVAVAAPVYDVVVQRDASHLWSELGYWLTKAGHPVTTRPADTPYGLLAAGRWRDAAAVWQQAGCRYEHALALSESTDTDDLRTALEILHELGAEPLAGLVRRQLRDLGVTAPRGPRQATRQNPAGLTSRQLEVLELLLAGRSNAEIADRLVLSVRTASNHVAAVLAKLGVRTRTEAAKRWSELAGSAAADDQ